MGSQGNIVGRSNERGFAAECDSRSGSRMDERERRSVEAEARCAADVAVERVAKNRVPCFAAVHAQLVRAAGAQPQRQVRARRRRRASGAVGRGFGTGADRWAIVRARATL